MAITNTNTNTKRVKSESVSLSYRLKAYRSRHGLSLRDFGRMVGISHAYVDNIEKGTAEPHTVQIGVLGAIAIVVGLSDLEISEIVTRAARTVPA
jgi:transcriptional regulator with XRE-family HTH domain